MPTIVMPSPALLAEHVPHSAALECAERLADVDPRDDRDYPGLEMSRAWSLVELGLNLSTSPDDIDELFRQAERRLNGALEDPELRGARLVGGLLLDVFFDELRDRAYAERWQESVRCSTLEKFRSLAQEVCDAPVHPASTACDTLDDGHTVCFSAPNAKSGSVVELAMVGVHMSAGHLVYTASERERRPAEGQASGSHQFYIVNDAGQKDAVRITRSLVTGHRVAPEVHKIRWQSIVRCAQEQGAVMAFPVDVDGRHEVLPDAAARLVLQMIIAEGSSMLSTEDAEMLRIVTNALSHSIGIGQSVGRFRDSSRPRG